MSKIVKSLPVNNMKRKAKQSIPLAQSTKKEKILQDYAEPYTDGKTRCGWATHHKTDAIFRHYHDEIWGQPVRCDRLLFEFLVLSSTQAGLSWRIVYTKLDNYRDAFDWFNIEKVAAYDEEKIESLLQNKGIIRNRQKITSAVTNAKCILKIQQEFGSFSNYLWGFVPNSEPLLTNRTEEDEAITVCEESKKMAKDMKKRGMKWVGPTILFAYMQSVGIIFDHTTQCYLHPLNMKTDAVKKEAVKKEAVKKENVKQET